MPKISVIMPCLNMERYIAESIGSVLRQTFSDIEILVIDAGSTDGTLDILKKCREADDRIRLIASDKKSYGYQVNMGIAMSKGDYIAIVDTDDHIVPDMYEALYPIAVESGADYVKGTANLFYTLPDGYVYRMPISQFEKAEYRDGKIEVEPRKKPELLEQDSFLWYGIYRREFLREIRLHETPGAAYQDLGGLLQTQLRAEKAVYIEKAVYEYRQDNFGASEYNPKAFAMIRDEYDWARQFLEGQPVEWKRAFYLKLFGHVTTRFPVMVLSGYFWEDGRPAMREISDRIEQAVRNGIIKEEDFVSGRWEQFQAFAKEPKKLYEEMNIQYQKDSKNMIALLFLMRARPTVIFGCGQYGKFVCAAALQNGVETIRAFCDSRITEDEDSIIFGKKVIKPETAAALYPDAIYIAASSKYSAQMADTLANLGVPKENIYEYTSAVDVNLLRKRLL